MLAPGTRLGVYEVVAAIGAGGMGEVYKAKDTRLDRFVAIKTLPDLFAADTERLARFEREAKTLAALNHPNIAQIYGVEESNSTRALVMELVEGETLADRIARGAIPIDEALPIAKQIAEGLEVAHEQGIIHRDLKPANVKITSDGRVKVLDFGLAKLTESSASSAAAGTNPSPLSMSPTITSPLMTGVGVLLGTAAYMSPEQAKGKPADKRSDIWAFGCVFYEMLTGHRAFEGEDVPDTLAAVLRGEPDWTRLPRAATSPVRALLRTCLHRDRASRIADLSTVRFVLQDGPAGGSSETALPAKTRSYRPIVVVALVTVIAGSIIGVYGVSRLETPGTPPLVSRLSVPFAANDTFNQASRRLLTLSPDGKLLAYVANNRLYVRHLDQIEAVPLRGVEGVGDGAPRNPFFSPDSQWIGFWQAGQLKKVSVNGGVPVAICSIQSPYGAAWGTDNAILFGGGPSGIWRVSSNGGTPDNIIKVKDGEAARSPQLLPDGHSILFTIATTIRSIDGAIVVQAPGQSAAITIVADGTNGAYVPTGHIAFTRRGALLAVPFDVRSLKMSGGPISLVESIASANIFPGVSPTGVAHFDVSAQGTLAYMPDTAVVEQRGLFWVDRAGREEQLPLPPRAYQYPRISPDGTRLALDIRDLDTDIWIWDFARETLTRLTFDPARDILPVWTPDSRRILFSSERDDVNSVLGAGR
jgi:serine/threonine-protein kinase